jgi:hypothetical protein
MRRIMAFAAFSAAASAGAATQSKQPVSIDSVWTGTKCQQTVALDSFKGQVASTDLAARIMMASRAHDVRWVPYGKEVKLRRGANRVTVQLDQENKVSSAVCG